MPSSEPGPRAGPRISFVVASLFAGFLFAGSATVLLGVMLPRLAAQYHLSDSSSGTFLMIQYATCASGALLVRQRLMMTLALGYLLMAAAAVALLPAPRVLAAPMIGLFGLGLGMAMTSTSVWIGRRFTSSRGSALSLLNFCWSGGASLCPLIVARLPVRFSLTEICIPVALLGAAFAALALPARNLSPARGPAPSAGPSTAAPLPLVALFSGIAFLYVGVEAAVGNWMSTYAVRTVSWNFPKSSLAAACFWGALLAGRGLTPLALRLLTETTLHLLSMVAACFAILLLLSAHSAAGLVTGACTCGLSLAPLYPLTIALFLERAGEARNVGWVFATAGYGGAALSWCTGVVSAAVHSLRAGLFVTLAAALVMLGLSLQMVSSMGRKLPSAS